MFASWGRLMWRRRVLVLVIGVASMALAGLFGTGVFARLQSAGGFTAPGSQSTTAAVLAQRAFGRDVPDVVVLYSSKSMTVADPAYRAAVTNALARLPRRYVASAESYFSTSQSRFVSPSRRQTYAVIGLAGVSDTARISSWDAISGRLGARGLTVQAGGQIPFEQAANSAVKSDITRAEVLSLPVVLILLAFIFGGLAAASLPLGSARQRSHEPALTAASAAC